VTATGKNYEIGKSEVWSFQPSLDTIIPVIPNCDILCDPVSAPLWVFGDFTVTTNPTSNPGGTIQITTGDNNSIYLSQKVQIYGQQIFMIRAEIVYFRWYSNQPDCKRCTNNDYSWGNLISGTVNDIDFNANGFSQTDEDGKLLSNSRQLDWTTKDPKTPAEFDGNINLRISLPAQTELACCTDCFRIQIRYSIVFKVGNDCIYCNTTKCYQITRQHRALNATIMNNCGDPIIIKK
jgi:hypothetical protein